MTKNIFRTLKWPVLVVALLVFISNTVFAGVVGSKHDLKGDVKFGNTQEICKVCHVPHKSASTVYLVPAGKIYSGGNITTYGGKVGQPTNSSSICLSCHDGILAALVGANLTNYTHSHPFSTVYTVQSGYATPSDGKITSAFGTLPLEGASNNQIECGTCHNPHEKGNSSKFLRIENTNSNMCLSCHQK